MIKFPSNPKYYVQPIFDPNQTHAVYGVGNDPAEINEVKRKLKEYGATLFRVVKNGYGFAIICFKDKKQQ
jgi:hypothetical protein